MTKLVEHVSYSSVKKFVPSWGGCPYYFKLAWVDKIRLSEPSIFTEFGKAVHDTLEAAMLGKIEQSDDVLTKHFEQSFDTLMKGVTLDESRFPEKEVNKFYDQGRKLVVAAIPALKEYFGEFEVVSAEEQLFQEFREYTKNDYIFKGFIDLVLKTPDGKYHIIDWKTTSWGWKAQKKGSPETTYQLTFYKKFFAEKHGIDPDLIETHFGLLKRTAKTNVVEIFRVTSGPRKTSSALKLLTDCVYNIDHGRFIKNKMACERCEYNRTEHCTGA